jgi:hypothetical protein
VRDDLPAVDDRILEGPDLPWKHVRPDGVMNSGNAFQPLEATKVRDSRIRARRTISYGAIDTTKLVVRPERLRSPVVHYGTIASGSSLIKNGKKRDKLRDEHRILCFERYYTAASKVLRGWSQA